MRDVIMVKSYCAKATHVLATVGKTAPARVGDFIAAHRAFVARDVDNFDDVRVVFVAAHRHFDALCKDCPFFIYATTHRRDFPRDDDFRNIQNVFFKRACPRLLCNFAQHLIFEILHLCIEFSH